MLLYLYGLAHYRYQAQAKRNAEHLEHMALVSQQNRQESGDVSLSRSTWGCGMSLLVFFCYRGYNHIAGKVLKKPVN